MQSRMREKRLSEREEQRWIEGEREGERDRGTETEREKKEIERH